MSRRSPFDVIDRVVSHGLRQGVGQLSALDEALDGRHIQLPAGRVLNFGSCSYLGLEQHPALVEGIKQAADAFGSQFSASRGYLSLGLYDVLEARLERMLERPVVACASTTLAHFAALPVLIGDGDAIVMDLQAHASIKSAAQLLRARGVPIHVIRHNALDELEEKLVRLRGRHARIWYLADGIYSMFGDPAPVHELEGLLERHEQLWLYVDDAHGFGWTGIHGRGFVRREIAHHERMVLAVSLNKSFACAGGALALPTPELRRRIRGCGPTLMFSGPIQPPMLGAAIASAELHLSPELPGLQAELAAKVAHTNQRLGELGLPQVQECESPLFFIPTGLPRLVAEVARRLLADGYYVNCGAFPAVPMRQGGMRFTITRNLRFADIDAMLERLAHHYPRVLREAGTGGRELAAAFRLPRLADTPLLLADRPVRAAPSAGGGLRLQRVRRADALDAAWWDRTFGRRGPMSRAALGLAERVFGVLEDPKLRADFHYAWVTDAEDRVVLATFFVSGWVKDDMFAPAQVSRQLEAIRQTRPDYLSSPAIVLGSPVSLGEHLYLDREHPHWAEALELLVAELQRVKSACGARLIVLRDFPAEEKDPQLSRLLLDLGFAEQPLPDALQLDELTWRDRAEYLGRLGQKYRYNVRREMLRYEDRFEVVTDSPRSPDEVRACYELYCQVEARGFEINVYRLPFAYFQALCAHPEYDVIRLYLRDDPREERRPVAVMFSHHAGGPYTALIVGLDYAFLHSHQVYKQVLFRTVERARALGASRLNLGFTAALAKKKLGARPRAMRAFVQLDDHYALNVMESLPRMAGAS